MASAAGASPVSTPGPPPTPHADHPATGRGGRVQVDVYSRQWLRPAGEIVLMYYRILLTVPRPQKLCC